jgi:hypothetical protein
MRQTPFLPAGGTLCQLLLDLLAWLRIALQSRVALSAENLFLGKHLALFQERQLQLRRATDATLLSLVLLCWPGGLTGSQP